MSVIIRLQNLPWSANALDIRQYFSGLSIPEGGVHIVGGELGDAFIAFSTDEDARQAFLRNHGKIKEIQINLLLSSRTEMQKVIEAARNMHTPFSAPVIQPSAIPPVIPNLSSPDLKSETKPEGIKKENIPDPKFQDDRSLSNERSDRKGRRRSRSRSRSRERRDRSRDRRERRRRERSRSRDRRDRRRGRDRSKSRERTRSKERDGRDNRDRKSRERRRDSRDNNSSDSPSNNSNDVTESINHQQRRPWDNRPNMQRMAVGQNNSNAGAGLLGKYPGQLNQMEERRHFAGIGSGMQNNVSQQGSMINSANDVNGRFQNNNDGSKRDWQNKPSRFSDNTNRLPLNTPMSGQMTNFQSSPLRPLLPQNVGLGNQRNLGIFANNMNLRLPYGQGVGISDNRPAFLTRPGGLSDMLQNRNMQNNYQYKTSNDMRDDDTYRTDSNEAESCVQLKPYYGGYGDVRRFFNGLHISNSGIKFVTDSNRKRTGTIYVKFVRPEARPQALRRSGHPLRGIVVDVTPISNEEFDKCGMNDNESEEEKDTANVTDKEEPVPVEEKKPFNCIVVLDIPTFAKEQDILKMFSDYSLLGIHIYKENKKRNAYVQFHKQEDAARALAEENKHTLGSKPIVVRPCTDKMLKQAGLADNLVGDNNTDKDEPVKTEEVKNANHYPEEDDYDDNTAASYDTDVILLSGMPHKTTDRDVIDFFSDIGLIPKRIHLCQANGIYGLSAECYCEFASADDAIAALDKNGMPLGSANVTVEPFPRREMEKILGMHQNKDITPNYQQPHHLPSQRFQGRLGPRPMLMGLPSRPLLSHMNHMRHPPMNNRYDGPYDGNSMGPPGCVLGMENVPFKANVDEILDFFRNFDISAHNILRRYNDNGTCTGEARVTFKSPAECQKAYDELKYKKIRDRVIYLRIL